MLPDESDPVDEATLVHDRVVQGSQDPPELIKDRPQTVRPQNNNNNSEETTRISCIIKLNIDKKQSNEDKQPLPNS